MLLYVAIFVSILVVYVIKAILHAKHWKRRGVPGPKSWPFIGNGDVWYNNDTVFALKMHEWTGKYGSVYGFQKGAKNILVISDPDLVKEIIVNRFDAFYARETSPILGDIDTNSRVHVFFARGKKWKRLRALSSPAFSVQNLKKVLPIVNDAAAEMAKQMQQRFKIGQSNDIVPFMFEYTLDVICRAAFGQNGTRQFNNPFRETVRFFFQNLGDYFDAVCHMFPSTAPLVRLLDIYGNPIRKQGIGKIINKMNEVVHARKKLRVSYKVLSSQLLMQDEEGANPEPVDFIDMFMNAETDKVEGESGEFDMKKDLHVTKKLTIDEVAASCVVFLLAGFDTTANVLTFTLYYLAKNPDIQEKLRREIQETCFNEDPSYEQLNALKYADAVMKETMRLSPIASAVFAREAATNTVVGDRIKIDAGTVIAIDTISYHRRKDIWGEDADIFRPERWFEDPKTEHFYGFGGGPRICVGMRLAYMEEKSALVYLLRNFRFREAADTGLNLGGRLIITPYDMNLIVDEI